MAELSGEDQRKIEAGAQAFMHELQETAPGILREGAAAARDASKADASIYAERRAVGDDEIL